MVRRAGGAAVVAGLMLTVVGTAPTVARAATRGPGHLGGLQAQAATLSARITALGVQEDRLANRYDGAVITLQITRGRVVTAQAAVTVADGAASAATSALQAEAVKAYVNAGLTDATAMASSDDATTNVLRGEYEETLASSEKSAEDTYELTADQRQAAAATLVADETSQARTVADIHSDVQSIQNVVSGLVSAERQDTGRIAVLVREQQAAEQDRAAAAEQRRLTGQRDEPVASEAPSSGSPVAAPTTPARTSPAAPTAPPTTSPAPATTSPPATSPLATSPPATSPPTTRYRPPVTSAPTTAYRPPVTEPPSTSPPTTSPPSPPASGETAAGAVALRAAMAELGRPYVWGGGTYSGPSGKAVAPPNQVGQPGFDCSGLVMYAYAQAGIYLQHYTVFQYQATRPIPMADVAPGDLVFAEPSSSGYGHVGMYIGGGKVINAPYTGVDVDIVPLTSFFVAATQVG